MATIKKIANLVAFVPGGARGIGKAIAARFVQEGAKVGIADLPDSPGSEVVKALGEDNCIFVPGDLTKEEDVKKAFTAITNKWNRLDVVLNNVTGGMPGACYDPKTDKMDPMDNANFQYEINLVTAFNIYSQAAQLMYRNEPDENGNRGIIVANASISGWESIGGITLHASAKRGLIEMTLAMAEEFTPLGIRVAGIASGPVYTDFILRAPEGVRKWWDELTPFPARHGTPDDLAHACQLVVENPHIRGEIVRIDGGLRVPHRR